MSATASAGRVGATRPHAPSRRAAATRPPRRVSGPAGGRAGRTGAPRRSTGAAAATARALPRPSVALSGRALAVVRELPNHSLIDRLVRGRAWIPVLGVLLAGIVAMQVEILKLGASTGRAVEHSGLLQTRNESLQASVTGLADDQRIERMAAGMGMTMPRPESLVFLGARPGGGIGKALSNIQVPNPSGFMSQLAAQAAAAAALMPAPPASSTGTSTTGTSGSSAVPTAATPTSSTAGGGTPSAGPSTTAPATTASGVAVAPSAASAPAQGSPSGTGSGAAAGGGSGGAASIAPATGYQSGTSTGG